jgi:catechol 2,3-dioxygenase-like lactoylglutathione lyase family enzyme
MEKHITGLDHVGLQTKEINKSVAFYEDLGFKKIYETLYEGTIPVVYLEQKGVVVEILETADVAEIPGPINHITLNTDDVAAAYETAKQKGLTITDDGVIHFLPFWENGFKYFMLEGPSKERIEIGQKL